MVRRATTEGLADRRELLADLREDGARCLLRYEPSDIDFATGGPSGTPQERRVHAIVTAWEDAAWIGPLIYGEPTSSPGVVSGDIRAVLSAEEVEGAFDADALSALDDEPGPTGFVLALPDPEQGAADAWPPAGGGVAHRVVGRQRLLVAGVTLGWALRCRR